MNVRSLLWLMVTFCFSVVYAQWRFPRGDPSLGLKLIVTAFFVGGFLTALRFETHYRQQRRRLRLDLCLRCGYDLRASVGRCPECGTKIEATAEKTQSPAALIIVRGMVILLVIYFSWLAMMAVHELGHVLHAYLSGGGVSMVYLHPFDFSRTDLSINPHPQFVAWGGPIWGSLIPLFAYGVICWLRLGSRKLACFFAGLCLVVNGVYVGVGWIFRAGDAETLLRHGASPWAMTVTGMLALGTGLYLWHRLGPRFGLSPAELVRKPIV